MTLKHAFFFVKAYNPHLICLMLPISKPFQRKCPFIVDTQQHMESLDAIKHAWMSDRLVHIHLAETDLEGSSSMNGPITGQACNPTPYTRICLMRLLTPSQRDTQPWATLSPQCATCSHLVLKQCLRVRECENALAVAKHLQTKPEIISVSYPFLEDSTSFENAKKHFSAGGGIVSFSFSDKTSAYAFLNRLHIIKRGTNVQDNKSLIIATYHTIYAEYSTEQKAEFGLTEGMIRLSVGIEDLEDLIADIDQALVKDEPIEINEENSNKPYMFDL